MSIKCLKKKGLVWKKLLECKLRGPAHTDTDCILILIADCTLILIASCLVNKLP